MEQYKKLNEFLNEKGITQKTDAILKSWVHTVTEEEFRIEIANALKTDFKVEKDSKQKSNIRNISKWLAVAAIIAIIFSVFMFNQNTVSPHALATQYLETQFVEHPGSTKGIAQSNHFRSDAILSFNQGSFAKAAKEFDKIMKPTQEDTYYLGLSFLKNGQYSKAIENLETCLSEGSRYKEEATWFLAISLIFDGKETDSKMFLERIEKNDWQYEKAQKLIKSLNSK